MTGEAVMARALYRGTSVGKVSINCPKATSEFQTAQAETVKKELQRLCAKQDPSILRGKTEEDLKSFSWNKLQTELEEKAPTLLKILMSMFENDSKKIKQELPAILSAATTLISVHNREMSAIEYIHSLILLKGGAKKVHLLD